MKTAWAMAVAGIIVALMLILVFVWFFLEESFVEKIMITALNAMICGTLACIAYTGYLKQCELDELKKFIRPTED